MRDFWKRTAMLAAIGLGFGIVAGSAILLTADGGVYYAPGGVDRTALYLTLSGLLGAVNMGTTTLYTLEHWGLLRCTLTHFVIVMLDLCAVGFALGWLSPREAVTLWIIAGSVAAYFIIWAIMYALYKRRIRRLNEALARWKARVEE